MDWAKINLQLFHIHILLLKVLFSFSKNLSCALCDSNKPSNVIYMTEYNPTFKILISQVICLRPKRSSVAITKHITESVTFFFTWLKMYSLQLHFYFRCPIYWSIKYKITNCTDLHGKDYFVSLYSVQSSSYTINGGCSLRIFI